MADDQRLERSKQRLLHKRNTAVQRINQIHSMVSKATNDPNVAKQLAVAAEDIDELWSKFMVENDQLLDTLLDLDQGDEYSYNDEVRVRSLIFEIKATVNSQREQSVQSLDQHSVVYQVEEGSSSKSAHDNIRETTSDGLVVAQREPSGSTVNSFAKFTHSKLPDIPLPTFDGELSSWPVFRDRFIALVDSRVNLSNVEKFYYLLGCLQADPLEVLKGITVSNDTYKLAWNALVERFDKPRKLASMLIDQLLSAPVVTSESLSGLNTFVGLFDENVAILESLDIPDIGSFLLFCMASRCLPMVSRRLFEAENTDEYPSIQNIIKFVRNRIQVLENAGAAPVSHVSKSTVAQPKRFSTHREARSALVSTSKPVVKSGQTKSVKCPRCSGIHKLADCAQFKAASVDERYNVVCTHRLCMVCFDDSHMSYKCSKSCSVCSRRHHALLHRDGPNPKSSAGTAQATLLGNRSDSAVLLATALVHVPDVVGCQQTVRSLIDSASQVSVLSSECCLRLGLRPARWTLPITGLARQEVMDVKGVVDLLVFSRSAGSVPISVQAYVMPSITSDMPSRQLPPQVRSKCGHLALADPQFDTPAPVELLLGADVFPEVWSGESISLGAGYPSAYNTAFGWALLGPIHRCPDDKQSSLLVSMVSSIENLMENFWKIEEPAAAPSHFTEDGQCEKLFMSEMFRDTKGRYTVPLPLRKDCSIAQPFPGMRQIALNRFYHLERKLARDPVLYSAYAKFMREYEDLGHMSLAEDFGSYFIPHHPVFKQIGEELKLRVVFDASARCQTGVSLNDRLYVGPKLQQDIIDVLVGFRVHRIAFTTDICKMYRQIWVHPKYSGLQRIFWRALPHEQVKEYTLHTVTYGVNCAPYLALRVLRHIADSDCEGAPSVSKALRHQTYMDDICVGADSVDAAKTLQKSLIRVLARSGLSLKKWASNSAELLAQVPAEDCVVGPLAFERGEEVQVLGMRWVPDQDCFMYDISAFKLVLSKRGVLSMIARIFDPLGFLAPTIFFAKCFMQRLWQARVNWDEPLPDKLKEEWQGFYYSLSYLSSIKVPRHLGSTATGKNYLLCGFCDASVKGYAAVVYLRVTDERHKNSLYLLGAKTKLAPIKPATVPRLELCGAVLLSSWLSRLRRILEEHLEISGVFAWSDSTTVLSWLSKPHTSFKQFVSNRIHLVQQALPDCRWAHVSSETNPADCVSRGLSPRDLLEHKLYWSGPLFLRQPVAGWSFETPEIAVEELPDFKPVVLVLTKDAAPVEWYDRFSSYDLMIRVVARMRRFVARCRRQPVEIGFLTRSELDNALFCVVRSAQSCFLSPVLRDLSNGKLVAFKPIARLCPFIDPAGVIRVGGRLRHTNWSEERKHQILVPKESYLSSLIARHWHFIGCHARPRLLSALIQRRFWILGVRAIAYRTIRQCLICVKLAAVNPQPLMADLPCSRVQESRPFSVIGVDYAGPLSMKETSLRKSRQYKVYLALFICMSTKAVHLELVLDLSTDAFLAALHRFVSRRGLPSAIHSDCGTNFVGTANLLRKLVNDPANRERLTAKFVCSWHFNPPSAPHFGGLWEAAVKSTKSLLVRTMGAHSWSLEEFTTILCRVEAALNSRPLTPLSSDPNELDCLTPGHFLIGQPLLSVPEGEVSLTPVSLRNRWKLLQQTFQSFWRRWSQEYLNTLQARGRWASTRDNIQLESMVVIKDQNTPPLSWRLGRVVELLPGSDNIVRVVKVLTSQGISTRPVVKLVPLPNA